ncbi:MAG: transglutaminase domain-containing protein [Candidatus Altiarchaeum hamiconexum]|uniref:Transglutaminase domain-containing protein n=1 Tax=Candidatus Altarchaeum hamiconexum TaxID=1803513 RepID=A0A8J7YTS8_9ARCH|nr:transglutaminase domain-containing protein [Candidatus Altarchaeum hamiconexum]PIV28163.1 MAG: hypothetical protein COS36_03170 [Candidatus Altarchaeum sp. CG03_land_8_20_14_0_80_32_618]PIX48849.1 MAG: hypothetical protein COZ53_02660 [Candidatus Altarchaeum sp. CG_4_8_14_3_um_filter_33_2054]PJC13818.1 MAG: hypothetical protein CO063_03535 [Candidatus Altarchaeum sp. CG_4_9_14_0_8_um_filter_32_206]NCN68507.1 transglutaminase domain-containing protein [Candidatus Altarchaeum hamiconexum]
MYNKSFWPVLMQIILLTTVMLSSPSAEITHSVINLTYEGNFEKEKANNIILTTEMPLTDETQKILKIQSDKKNYFVETKNGNKTIKINAGSADNYFINFIVEKKFYGIKFNNDNDEDEGNRTERWDFQDNLEKTGNVKWNEKIKKTAENITNNWHDSNKDIEDAVKAFRIAKFVYEYVTYDYNSEILSAEDVFNYGQATCMGYTNLFIAMCRSVGIPARAVGGIAYTNKGFERHSYAEVFIGKQWIPIDPTFLQLPADASHVAFYRDNEARGINVELKWLGKNVSHKGTISAKFISLTDESPIDGWLFNKNLTGENSVMPITVELTNKKNFYVFGICKISSLLKADKDEKIFYISPYEKKNLTFKVFVPELNEGFLYFPSVNIRCNNLNLTAKFTVDTDKTGNIYNGVVIENINTHSKEIDLKNLNEESENRVNVSIIVQNTDKTISISENKTVVVEKGAKYVLKYAIKYPSRNFTLMVKCAGENFSDNKNVVVNVVPDKKNYNYEILDQGQNFVKNIGSEGYLIAAFVLVVMVILIYFKFRKNKPVLKYKNSDNG